MEAQQEAAGSAAPIPPESEAKISKARVEKLKRRIIRAVAAKTSQTPGEDEMENMWEMMKRSSKCDCKVLWKHMRAVTLKKLKRLLPAEDRIENITAIARLTITDWLLFDLVLVHEDIDVIGRDLWEKNGEEPEPLMELFFLVDEYKIERLKGTDLIDAWLKLTREYNDGGRKCSPMLLQRRWYQMKEAARKRFYNFWGNYRGNPSLMSKAKRFQPTVLQVDIVRKNKHLIVNSFTEWNELIENGRIILANEFDNRINAQRKRSTTDAGPELEVIEQNVETISLEGDSDEDDSKDATSCESSLQNNVTIKREPEDEDLIEIHENNIDILQSVNIPCETPFGNNEESPPHVDYNRTNEETRFVDNSYQRKNKEIADISQSACDDIEILEESCNIDNEVSAFAKTVSDTAAKRVCNDLEASIACDELSDSDNVELIDIFNSSQLVIETPFLNKSPEGDIIKQENYIETGNNRDTQAEQCQEQTNLDYLPRIENVTSIAQSETISTENTVKSILTQKAKELELKKGCCLTEKNDSSNNSTINDQSKVVVEKIANDRDFLGNFEELPSDIHFVDDGIALDDDVEDRSDFRVQVKVEETNDEVSEETESAKIDLKLLLLPIVYTKKLDHMDVFKFIEYEHIRDGRILECASVESKPVDSKSIKLEDISPSKDEEHHSNLVSDSSDQEDTLLEVEHQRKDITTETEMQSNKESASSDEEDIPLNTLKNRVHIKSWLLRKPRVQNYNPIQLCKNPDFNTRLKRLTTGFLTFERNRKYLKQCHPLTIDLHKAFEEKLTNNTLYLKGVDLISNKPASLTENAITHPISISSPSFPQNVSIDNDIIEEDFVDIISNSPMLCERNKQISLPDITEIRRLNQKLLTAEVAPLQIATPSPPEMNATDAINIELIDQNKSTTQEVHNTSSTINKLVPSNDSCSIKHHSLNIDAPVDTPFKASNDRRISEDRRRIDHTISGSDKSIFGKKQQQKPKPHRWHSAYKDATWISKPAKLRNEEFLLASDTVDKMLFLFTGEDIAKKKEKSRVIKEHINKAKDTRDKPLEVLSVPMDLKESTPITVTEKEKPVKDSDQDALKSKRSKKNHRFCCWASRKYSHPNLKQRHPCKKPLCTCCCKEKLISKVVLGDKIEQPRNETIILSDEEKDPGNMQTRKKICVVNVASTKNQTELPNATSIVIDGKTKKVNVPNHVIRNNYSSIDENDIMNCEPSTLVANSVTNITNQSNLQNVHNITDTVDNSSELPYGYSVGLSETVVTQNDTRVYNSEQMMLPTIPPLLESLPSCTGTRKITITVKALNQPISSNGNTVPNHSISNTVSDVTPQTPVQPLEVPPLAAPPKPIVTVRKRFKPRIKTAVFNDCPPKPLELPNKTVRVKVKKQEKLSSAPIFVGVNKILLSTVKTRFPPRLSIDPPKISLPNGVHFVLLPNNELALSIEPGVELNTNQLSHLQTVIQTLQTFLGVPSKCMNILDNSPIVIDDDEKQNPQEIETENQIESVSQLETYSQLALTDGRTEEKNITSVEIENNKFANEPNNVEPNNVEPNNVEPNNVEPNNVEPNNVEPNNFESNNVEPNNVEPNNVELNNVEPNIVEHNKDIGSTISNTEREFVNDNDNLEKTNDISRKTILSDLMEMSGICEEDAKLPEIPVLSTITPDIDLTPLENAQDGTEMHPDILKLFNTPTALASLARRPDLSIITTYSDLKYAFQEEAKFFKLDVTSGDISPINVFIKNKESIRSSLNPPKKSRMELIDLTEDDTENDNIFIESEASNIHAKNSANTAVTPSEAKPLKLFRAMHSSLLRNSLHCKGTELVTNAIRSGNLRKKLDGKKILKIVNINRRKQNLNELKRFDMETAVDVENPQETPQSESVHPSEYISDDSDDEPLAKKAKRNKQQENAVTVDQHQNIESTESIDLPNEKTALVEVVNPMMYEGLDPEFGSFEADCEEDCILGV